MDKLTFDHLSHPLGLLFHSLGLPFQPHSFEPQLPLGSHPLGLLFHPLPLGLPFQPHLFEPQLLFDGYAVIIMILILMEETRKIYM